MKIYCALLLVLMSAATLAAQTVPPALMVKQNGVSTPLGLAALRTDVRIFGSVAETTMTMTFSNPTARAMEGDLYFPLPEGATISGYALDINGVLVDGVAVEKHEARQVYEAVVRQGIDPGLVQWTAGNNFQTRVFPIPANGSRTVRVQYVTELTGGRDTPAYRLPLRFKDKIGEFSLRVEVVKSATPPQVTKGELTNFAFEKWRDSYVAETKQQNWTPVEDLVDRAAEDRRAAGARRAGGRRADVFRHSGLSGAAQGQPRFDECDAPAGGGFLGRLRLAGRRPQAGNRRPARILGGALAEASFRHDAGELRDGAD